DHATCASPCTCREQAKTSLCKDVHKPKRRGCRHAAQLAEASVALFGLAVRLVTATLVTAQHPFLGRAAVEPQPLAGLDVALRVCVNERGVTIEQCFGVELAVEQGLIEL